MDLPYCVDRCGYADCGVCNIYVSSMPNLYFNCVLLLDNEKCPKGLRRE